FTTGSSGFSRSPQLNFDFSRDTNDGKIYGIDVSHHNGQINWSKVAKAGVRFAYIKATQGTTFVDRLFSYNIQNSTAHQIPSGAYHFLSSSSEASTQTENFIKIYSDRHGDDSLPPVLDLEWDYDRSGYDRWKNKTSSEIVEMCLPWLEKVESEFGMRPLIYTNKFWWEEILGREGDHLQGYAIWMSRYGRFQEPSPPLMDRFNWLIWQFTEKGAVDGVPGTVDVNWCKPEFLSRGNPAPDSSCNLDDFKKNNATLSEEEMRSLYTSLRSAFGRFNQEQVDFLNVLIETSAPADLRSFIHGSYDPKLDTAETANFFSKAETLFGNSSSEVYTLKTLLELARPSAVRRCILE
ncbi:MAG: hypothetical protein D3925_14840, partial [Candidatus Electrothrix sp. AR5]|nr:hypothetical protein [Candidatus Electrothrix sp. AR5]